jgi:hypothetical protein
VLILLGVRQGANLHLSWHGQHTIPALIPSAASLAKRVSLREPPERHAGPSVIGLCRKDRRSLLSAACQPCPDLAADRAILPG